MCIINNNNEIVIGKSIPKDLSLWLKMFLNQDDLVDISDLTNVSYTTVKTLYYRNAIVTTENNVAADKMISLAKAKCDEASNFFKSIKSKAA